MKYLLQQYDNGKWGYKCIDDCSNKNMSNNKSIGEDCKILNEQKENEDREAFFARINQKPNDKEYGSNEKLDLQVNDDENKNVRTSVAELGYGLNKLINDRNKHVRAAVAEQGYGLDKLVNDKEYIVRHAVAKQGYGLDKLINDKSPGVRAAVAGQGYGLEKLVNDKCDDVRMNVAEQGYGLNKLINDKNEYVRRTVLDYIGINKVSLNDLVIVNEDFSNEYFYNSLDEDSKNIFFTKYFEQFVKEKLSQMKRDEWFYKIIELCDDYNNKEIRNKEIRNILDDYF